MVSKRGAQSNICENYDHVIEVGDASIEWRKERCVKEKEETRREYTKKERNSFSAQETLV